MNDQEIMENVLLVTKGVCDLYMHGTIESAGSGKVHDTFNEALKSALCMQENVYEAMEQQGFYTVKTVPKSKIETVKNKFSKNV